MKAKKKIDPLPYSYITEGKTAHFEVDGSNEIFSVRFQSVEALNRDLPRFINVLFAVSTHYRKSQKP